MRLVPERSLRAFRRRGLPALALLALAASPAYAQREDQGLQLGCANDYFRLCAGVDPNSPDADKCMVRNRKRLSPECRAAITSYDKRTGSKSLSDD
ncbi:hypothetical protein MKK75_28245 [Methylobacterium sp. J-030]|uniref:hypothetical protein n=1 Tax=Methylobacterium sp. J-030 TaxID=2836627 RepID=UPI001FBA7668|nr:hypothetical protein [Methylobacterium sp. J-030]MCJ2072635.1 hypothetical protein [Methylobacterium sp. J-030]